jgi:hypothetical protein
MTSTDDTIPGRGMRSNGAGIEQIAVRAGDHGVGVLVDADSGAFQALVSKAVSSTGRSSPRRSVTALPMIPGV